MMAQNISNLSKTADGNAPRNQCVYIVDLYDPYYTAANSNVIRAFHFRDIWYCIRKVELEWGQPILTKKVDDEEFKGYHLYSTLEEAEAYIHELKKGEGRYLYES